MRGKGSGCTVGQLADMVLAEALHRAHGNIDLFLCAEDSTPPIRRDVRRVLAKRYNKMLDEFKLDGLPLPETGEVR